jgi:hypothetical protein
MKLLMSQQTKDFVRFLGLVAILYLGDWLHTLPETSWQPADSVRLRYHLHLPRAGPLLVWEDELDIGQSLLRLWILGAYG